VLAQALEIWEPDSSLTSDWLHNRNIPSNAVFSFDIDLLSSTPSIMCRLHKGLLRAVSTLETRYLNNNDIITCTYSRQELRENKKYPCRNPFCTYECGGSTSDRVTGILSAKKVATERTASISCVKVILSFTLRILLIL